MILRPGKPVFDILLIDQPLSLNERYNPLAFEMLSAYLEKRGLLCHCMGFYNRNIAAVAEVPVQYIVEHLERKNFRFVGLSLPGFDMIAPSNLLAQAIKSRFPQVKIVVGGFFTTFYPREILEKNPGIDYLVVGDGEEPLFELLTTPGEEIPAKAIPGLAYRHPTDGNVVYTSAAPQQDLMSLPLPSTRYLEGMIAAFGRDVAIAGLCTSKGCRNNCSFCSVAETSNLLSPHQRRRALTAERVLELIAHLVSANTRLIRVVDTDFIGGDADRAAAIANGIINAGWNLNLFIDVCFSDLDEDLFRLLAQAGFNGLVGIESLSAADRKLYRKIRAGSDAIYRKMEAIEKTGFQLYSSFILYNPRTTLDDLELNLAFIRRFRKSFKCKTFFTYLRVDKSPFLSKYLEGNGMLDHSQAEQFRDLAPVQSAVADSETDRLQLLLPYSFETIPQFLHPETAFVFHNMYKLLYWSWFYQFRMILYHNMDRSCFTVLPPTEDAGAFLQHSNALFDLCADTMQSLIEKARRNDFELANLKAKCNAARVYWKSYVEQEANIHNLSPYLTVEDRFQSTYTDPKEYAA
jgi:radical SAM superfamily enzyme YgiQ (UPF0313 family)